MKFVKISLIVVVLLALGLFLLGNQMTPAPGTSSGNGNPALFIALILVPLFFILVVLWVYFFREYSIRMITFIIGMIAILVHLIIAFLYQKNELDEYRQIIKEALIERNGAADPVYIQDITTGLSIHINNQYFNLNTFFMFITFSLFVAIAYRLWDFSEKKEDTIPYKKS